MLCLPVLGVKRKIRLCNQKGLRYNRNKMMEKGIKRKVYLKKLTAEQVLSIYTGVAKEHFPVEELKPAAVIERLLREGAYEGLGMFDGERLAAYALFAQMPKSRTLLLDYYAVLDEYRNGGVGSLFLGKMRQFYSDRNMILLETEKPASAKNEAEYTLRVRRNCFYERNGALLTGIRSRVYDVDFDIFLLPLAKTPSDEEAYQELSGLYRYMLGEENYRRHVSMEYAEESPKA